MRVYNRNKHAQRPYHISKQVVLSIKGCQKRYTFQAFSETRLLFPFVKVCQLKGPETCQNSLLRGLRCGDTRR